MPAELGDPESFKRAMREAVGEVGKQQIEDAVDDAVRHANKALRNAAESPPEGASMDEWHVEPIADSVEVYWVEGEPEGKLEQGDAYVAEWTHPHADKLEVGVKPHTIEADDGVLVFEWPDMPEGVEAQFEDQWESEDSFLERPEVAFVKVEHPGIPALGYIRGGFAQSLAENFR